MHTASSLIEKFNLQRHPEGGWFRETYRSKETIPAEALPERFTGGRAISTAIYFLLEARDFSAFHRIKSDECWHFYAGDPLELFILEPGGNLTTILLGPEHEFQYIVPAECWFASRPAAGSRFCFVGCTVAPGFDFGDFELGNADELTEIYPEHRGIVAEMCR